MLLNRCPVLRSFALLTVSIWGISQAKAVLVPLILAAMLAFVLAPGVRFLRRHSVPEPWAMLCATLVFVIPLAAIAYEAVIQGEAFVRSIPQIMQHLQSGLGRIANAPWAARFHLRERLASSPWLSNGSGPGFGANLEVALRGGAVISYRGRGAAPDVDLLFADAGVQGKVEAFH